jgi:hypothetical protein
MMRAEPVRLFKPWDERINIGFPLVLIALALLELALSLPLGSVTRFWKTVLVDIVFLNITHNAFTYLMLLGLPEMRAWIRERSDGKLNVFWTKILALNLALFLLFFFLLKFWFVSPLARAVFLLLTASVPVHHGLAQALGLSLSYNKMMAAPSDRDRVEIPPDARAKLARNEWLERKAYWALIVGSILAVAGITFRYQAMAGSYLTTVTYIYRIGFWLLTASCIVLIGLACASPLTGKRNKILFSIRNLLWPLSMFSVIALWGTMAVHGVEYAFVSRKMISNASAFRLKAAAFALIAIVAVMAYFRGKLMGDLYGERENEDLFLYVATSLSIAGSYSHYALDRMMFRMRDELNRRYCGKLLQS